jgi:hypothetical protein
MRRSLLHILKPVSAIIFASACASASAAEVRVGNERLSAYWHGQWVDYVEVGDHAVTQGDIIIGQKDAVRKATQTMQVALANRMLERAKALTVDSSLGLWPKLASGVAEVPYVFEAGNLDAVTAAVTEANRALKGIIQWVPRTDQVDYVAFNLVSPGSGSCASALGRIGGRQSIVGEPACDRSVLLHEMGHAMGLLHVQQDVDTQPFIDTRLDRIGPTWRSQSDQTFYSRTLNGYDYASIMHYGRFGFNAYTDLVTMETKPAGIDIGYPTTYSTADVDALARLTGLAPVATTIVTHPAGLKLIVDGAEVTAPVTYAWPVGSVHRIWVAPGLQSLDGFQFGFARWSQDPSTTPSRQLTWQVAEGDGTLGAPTSAPISTVLTANFSRLTEVTASPVTQAGGSVTVTPRSPAWPGTTSFYPQYSLFDIRADANAGFTNFTTATGAALPVSGGTGFAPSSTLLLFPSPAHTIGAGFVSGNTIGVAVTGDGMSDGIRVNVTSPTGATTRALAPLVSTNTAGNWTYSVTSPQTFGTSGRYVVDGIDGLDNAAAGTVAMPTNGSRTVTVRAHREWQPFKQVVPGCAGTVTLSDSSAYLRVGSSVTATVSNMTSAQFTGWTGTVAGTATSVSSTVGALVPEFVATFNTTATPLRLDSITPPNYGDDVVGTIVTLTGAGFTADTRVSINRVLVTPTFVDTNTLRLNLTRAQLPFVGRLPVYVYNALSSTCPVNSNSVALDVLPVGQKVRRSLTEYYHAGLDYYFLTGRDSDKALLDTAPGWTRTGSDVKIFARPNARTIALERHFFANVARNASRGSHFFTVIAPEQALLTSLNPTNAALDAKPLLEGVEGYAIPTVTPGVCPANTIAIYRAFKGTPRYVDDGNHRFSTSLTQHQDMVNRLGWTDEGVAFCALP